MDAVDKPNETGVLCLTNRISDYADSKHRLFAVLLTNMNKFTFIVYHN